MFELWNRSNTFDMVWCGVVLKWKPIKKTIITTTTATTAKWMLIYFDFFFHLVIENWYFSLWKSACYSLLTENGVGITVGNGFESPSANQANQRHRHCVLSKSPNKVIILSTLSISNDQFDCKHWSTWLAQVSKGKAYKLKLNQWDEPRGGQEIRNFNNFGALTTG